MEISNINIFNKKFVLNIITPEFMDNDDNDKDIADDIIKLGQTAIDSKTSLFQLRNKNISGNDFYYIAMKLIKFFNLYSNKENKPILIVNDRADIADIVGADGVHIGDDDLPLSYIKKIYPQLIAGVSVKNIDEAKKAEAEGADYIGAGSVFETSSKSDAGKPIGLDILAKICDSVKIPVIAIGGINLDNVEKVIETGIKGIAVIGAVSGAKDPLTAAIKLNSYNYK
ncbi:MAG: thiamine phosphate synthase [Candidatus Acididesulfobacter diazotrophicus]|jgi:thiamine-phosphate pyrophosphorylase|uniref:Thiamine-phosphate synthase n=1 Tax=Candidatus Acididesulfobacter diazotrophicus TaxID=2597226 RepID=A0A519BPR3_9DELT|nr:MAG: thiamine phosphate synthase [Candidatus Acididesulfobacter diazotrophicus]